METASPEGALAFAEYYLKLTVYGLASGDLTEIETVSGPDCRFCKAYFDDARPFIAEGNYSTTPEIRIVRHRQWQVEGTNDFRVDVVAYKGEYDDVSPEGEITHQGSEQFLFGFVLRFDNGWTVVDAEATDPSIWDETEPEQ